MDIWTYEQWESALKEPKAAFYLYTPMCGTCAVASQMMKVITTMRPEIPIGKADLNYVQRIALDYEIESVPCLLIQKDGDVVHKIYAFQSVPYLLESID